MVVEMEGNFVVRFDGEVIEVGMKCFVSLNSSCWVPPLLFIMSNRKKVWFSSFDEYNIKHMIQR